MIDHALQPVARVDHVRNRLDVPQLDETVAAKLEVRRITPFARHTFTRDFVRIVDGHDVFSLSDVGLMGLMGRQSPCLLVPRSLRSLRSLRPFITAKAFRFNPASFARLIALLRKRVENSSCDISTISRRLGSTTPSRGSKRSSAVSFEKRDQGQTSWQMSQPKTQPSRFDLIGSGSSGSRSSIVP